MKGNPVFRSTSHNLSRLIKILDKQKKKDPSSFLSSLSLHIFFLSIQTHLSSLSFIHRPPRQILCPRMKTSSPCSFIDRHTPHNLHNQISFLSTIITVRYFQFLPLIFFPLPFPLSSSFFPLLYHSLSLLFSFVSLKAEFLRKGANLV